MPAFALLFVIAGYALVSDSCGANGTIELCRLVERGTAKTPPEVPAPYDTGRRLNVHHRVNCCRQAKARFYEQVTGVKRFFVFFLH